METKSLDDQLGLSWSEKERFNAQQDTTEKSEAEPARKDRTLPVMEPLLADKPEHKNTVG